MTEEETKIKLDPAARPSREEEEAAAAKLSPEAQKLVDKMAEDTVASFEKAKENRSTINRSFYGKRNRKAWDRMNRKHRLEAMERGDEKIHALLGSLDSEEVS